MRAILTAVILAACAAGVQAQDCVGGRCVLPRRVAATTTVVPGGTTVVAPSARRVVVNGGAQSHAEQLAATGIEIRGGQIAQRHHAGGVGREGLGFSTRSPQDAIERSCMYGRYPVREQATAWCPSRRGWIAVVRYE